MKIKEKKGVLAAKEFLRKKRYPHWQEFTWIISLIVIILSHCKNQQPNHQF
jgi:hypothetical protein